MFEAPYARARDVATGCLAGFEPEERLTVPAYAVRHRKLDNAGGGHVGDWQNEKVPYTVRPSECLTSLDFLTTCVVGPGQVAKTVIAENWLLHSVGQSPADMLWYMQTDDGVEAYVKGRINPMIDLHEEELKAKLGKRSVDDSLHFKSFRGMTAEFLSASPKTLINKSAPRIVADEYDNWAILNAKGLLDVRRQTFGQRSMLLILSHPDQAKGLDPARDWNAGIMSVYADSDRNRWHWPCPHCRGFSSPCPGAARVMELVYPSEADVPLEVVQREARLLCPCCGRKIADEDRKAMNLAAFQTPFGGWIGQGQEIDEGGTVRGELQRFDTAGFWIVGAMSPFVLGGIGGLASARVKAERDAEIDLDDAPLRQVIVKQWGIPFTPFRQRPSMEAQVLVDRADVTLKRGLVPDWVRFLTVAVDVQKGYFEYLVRGWAAGKESVVIETGKILAQPETNPKDWDAMRAQVFDAGWPLADGTERRMRVRCFGFDLHGEEGVSQQAYAAWQRWRRQGLIKLYGLVSDRECWNILPLRGASTLAAPTLIVSYPDTGKASNKAASRGEVPVGAFNPNRFKNDLLGQLRRAEPGETYIHLPAWLKSPMGEAHPWFDQLVSERPAANGRWEKIESHRRNEALDLMVMSHVLAHLAGVHKIDWQRPPSWARSHDISTYISPPPGGEMTIPAEPLHRKLA